jgi:hypothetical protein
MIITFLLPVILAPQLTLIKNIVPLMIITFLLPVILAPQLTLIKNIVPLMIITFLSLHNGDLYVTNSKPPYSSFSFYTEILPLSYKKKKKVYV